jgi:hypothetical protein
MEVRINTMVEISLAPVNNGRFGIKYQCLNMEDRLRNNLYFIAKNNISFRSVDSPEIRKDCIFLWGGESSNDNNKESLWFDTEEERDEHILKIIEAFEEFRQYLKEENTIPKTIILSTYDEVLK